LQEATFLQFGEAIPDLIGTERIVNTEDNVEEDQVRILVEFVAIWYCCTHYFLISQVKENEPVA